MSRKYGLLKDKYQKGQSIYMKGESPRIILGAIAQRVLVKLLTGPSYMGKISADIDENSPSVLKALDVLKRQHLVIEVEKIEFPVPSNMKYYNLTPMGEMFAKSIEELEEKANKIRKQNGTNGQVLVRV